MPALCFIARAFRRAMFLWLSRMPVSFCNFSLAEVLSCLFVQLFCVWFGTVFVFVLLIFFSCFLLRPEVRVMPCFQPLTAYRFHGSDSSLKFPSGKARLFFGKSAAALMLQYGGVHEVITLPCSKCVGCLVRKVSDWSLRCVFEAQHWERSSFLTLTYRTSELPANFSLLKSDHQKFFKRLRQALSRDYGVGAVKYYMCGEYGERKGRPHYHVVLFGWDFPDKVPVANNPGARDPLFTSPFLERVWGHGEVRIGDVTSESTAYVARYTLKKLRGKVGAAFYEARDQVPPYTACSQGVGRRHFERFRSDYYPCDSAVDPSTLRPRAVPRYFDKLLEAVDAEAFAVVKEARALRFLKANRADQTPARLRDREECLRLKLGLLLRNLEVDNAAADSRRSS